MKTTESVRQKLYPLFEKFANNGISDLMFVKALQDVCKVRGKKTYWWRFFSNDTGANDPQSVNSCLQSPKNREFIKECIQITIESRQLEVYYS